MTEKLRGWNDPVAEADTLAKRKAASQAIAKGGGGGADFFGELLGIPVGIATVAYTGDPALGLTAYKGTKTVVEGVDKLLSPDGPPAEGASDLVAGVTDFARVDKAIQDNASLALRKKTLETLSRQKLLDAKEAQQSSTGEE